MSKSSYTNLKRGAGLPATRLQVFWGRVPYVAAALITLVAVWVVVASLNEEAALPEDDVVSHTVLTDLTAPHAFRRAYLKANGGLELLNVIQSVRLSGTMESAGVVRPFFSMRKRADRVLLTFDFDTHDLTFAVDGDVVWQRTRVPGQDPQVRVLEGAQAASFMEMREFFDPMLRLFFLDAGELHGIEVAEWQGEPCLRVRFSEEGSALEIEALVDGQTMNPMARIERFTDGRVRKSLYEDYRSLRGMQEPFEVETYLDDVLQNRVVIEHADSNLGVVPWMFEVPEGWRAGNLQD